MIRYFELHGPVIDSLNTRFETAWILASGDTLPLFKLPTETLHLFTARFARYL